MVQATVQGGKHWRTRIPCEWCEKTHFSWYNLARCRWRKGLAWVAGNPPVGGECYALVSYCRHPYPPSDAITVTLWDNLPEAQASKDMIDRTGCGGSCSRRHRIYTLHDETEVT